MPNADSLTSGATPAQVAADLTPLLNFQADGISPDDLRTMVADGLLPHLMRYDAAGFQSMFNTIPPAEAQLGAEIMLQTNQGVTNWQVSPGGAMLEELCAQALCRLFGLGPNADATFMYSGTYANQQALYLALHHYAEQQGFDLAEKGIAGFGAPEKLAVLISADAHFSMKHAVRMLGLGEQCLVTLPVDADYRIDAVAMQEIVRTMQQERDLVCMVATAGTTSTGAVDPIDTMADLCAETGAWLHIDGAYGYAYQLVPEWSHLFSGHHRANSITWDPHKQVGAPIPNSVLFVKDKKDFGRMALHSSYFNRADDVEPNPGLKSPPSTRPMSVLPLVTLLRGQGLNRVIENLRAPLVAMRKLADYLDDQPHIECCHQPDTGVLCFRMTPDGLSAGQLDALQLELFQQTMASGQCSISTTTLNGQNVLRVVSVSPHITFADLQTTIQFLQQLVRKVTL